MTHDEAWATLNAGGLVRIDPRHGKNSGSQHWGRGRIVAVLKRKAEVVPFGHKSAELIPLEDLKRWKAKDPGFEAEQTTTMAKTAQRPANVKVGDEHVGLMVRVNHKFGGKGNRDVISRGKLLSIDWKKMLGYVERTKHVPGKDDAVPIPLHYLAPDAGLNNRLGLRPLTPPATSPLLGQAAKYGAPPALDTAAAPAAAPDPAKADEAKTSDEAKTPAPPDPEPASDPEPQWQEADVESFGKFLGMVDTMMQKAGVKDPDPLNTPTKSGTFVLIDQGNGMMWGGPTVGFVRDMAKAAEFLDPTRAKASRTKLEDPLSRWWRQLTPKGLTIVTRETAEEMLTDPRRFRDPEARKTNGELEQEQIDAANNPTPPPPPQQSPPAIPTPVPAPTRPAEPVEGLSLEDAALMLAEQAGTMKKAKERIAQLQSELEHAYADYESAKHNVAAARATLDALLA